ncbi:MAG: hypothetical protein E7401_02640 [Ruminococcaceae bacterium]|nr:hypothetical protein [Oscillospiraceae bacterium]
MRNKANSGKSKFSWVQGCWLVVSLLLFCGGIFAVTRHESNLVILANPLGGIMFLTGAINILVCDIKNHDIHGARWLIADGVTALLLSLFPLFNQMVWPIMIPFFFGMWELFSGILKVMDASELKNEKIHCWKAFAVIGWIELMSGTASLIKPFDDLVGFNRVIGIIFLVQSCGFLLKTISYKDLTE